MDIFLGTKLKIYAIFSNSQECLHVRYDSFSFSYCIYIVYLSFFLFVDRLPWMQDPCFGAYSSITDLLFGFDEAILQSAFGVWIYLLMYGLYFVVLEMILGQDTNMCIPCLSSYSSRRALISIVLIGFIGF